MVNAEQNQDEDKKKIDYSLGLRKAVEALNASRPDKSNEDGDSSDKDADADPLAKGVSSSVIKQCLETLTRNIDRMTNQEKEDQKDYMVSLVQNDIRNAELDKMFDLVKEVDFAVGEQISGAFNYREKDYTKRI